MPPATPHAESLLRLRRDKEGFVEVVSGPVSVQGFVDPESGVRYAIVVNDDLQQPQDAVLKFAGLQGDVTDVVHAKALVTADGAPSDPAQVKLSLDAGDGVLLSLR